MQTAIIDLSLPGVTPVFHAMQGDSMSRFFSVTVTDSGVPWYAPSGAAWTVRFGAPGMPSGWYDTITEPDGGSHPAISVDGHTITVELAEQAVSVQGKNRVWLLLNAPDGYQLASWGFDLFVEAVQGLDAPEATVYYNALAEQVAQTLANAQAASESAAQAQRYAESIDPSQFANATSKNYTITVPASGWADGALTFQGVSCTKCNTVAVEGVSADTRLSLGRYVSGDLEACRSYLCQDTGAGTVTFWATDSLAEFTVELVEVK